MESFGTHWKEKSYNKERYIARDGEMDCEIEINDQDKESQAQCIDSQEGEGQGQDAVKEITKSRVEKRTKMVKHEGKQKYVEDIRNYEDIIKNQVKKEEDIRFNSSHRGEPILEAVFDPRVRTSNKNANTVKIIQYIKKLGCNIERIKNSGFGKAEVTFIDVKNANKCIEKSQKDVKGCVKVYIPNRVKRYSRGIIKDWDIDMPIHELIEEIDDNKNISQIKRMRRRKYNVQERNVELASCVVIWRSYKYSSETLRGAS